MLFREKFFAGAAGRQPRKRSLVGAKRGPGDGCAGRRYRALWRVVHAETGERTFVPDFAC
jgi:hypothetical protein